jgi:hypothetical protein
MANFALNKVLPFITKAYSTDNVAWLGAVSAGMFGYDSFKRSQKQQKQIDGLNEKVEMLQTQQRPLSFALPTALSAIHFGKWKWKLKKSQERKDNVLADTESSTEQRREAINYAKEMEKATQPHRELESKLKKSTNFFTKTAATLVTAKTHIAAAPITGGASLGSVNNRVALIR